MEQRLKLLKKENGHLREEAIEEGRWNFKGKKGHLRRKVAVKTIR